MNILNELISYFNKPEKEIQFILDNRETILEFEYLNWRKANPALPILDYYKVSNFMLFSNAQDEIERDLDTDWDDMHISLAAVCKDRVLDFGSGIGSAGHNLKGVKEIAFCEPNIAALNFSIQRKSLVGRYKLSSIEHIVGEYDLIIAWGVFEHLSDSTAVITFNQLLRHLAPDGKIFLKNFYEQHDAYLLHFAKGSEISKLFAENSSRIIFAKNSH